MEIAIVVAVVLVLAAVQVRRRGSRLQRADDPRAHLAEGDARGAANDG
ncbi:MAG: hypothetical protein R2701_09190 [Acidimicrobiales bacterium]|nr:hypothetical protein [Acidimicrobiales bacterium]